jgi:hypothetical protein
VEWSGVERSVCVRVVCEVCVECVWSVCGVCVECGVVWSGVEWSGVEWSGVEWSGVEWSGVSGVCVWWGGADWIRVCARVRAFDYTHPCIRALCA